MVATGFFLASLFATALGNPLGRRAMTVHESRSEVPEGFVNQGAASPDTVLNLRIALTQNNPSGLETTLLDISDPKSDNYGKWLTKEQVSSRLVERNVVQV